MNRVLYIRIHRYKIRMTTAAEGIVIWQDKKISIGQIHFTINELRSMVYRLYKLTRLDLMGKALLLNIDR